jgi:hypothetical protein
MLAAHLAKPRLDALESAVGTGYDYRPDRVAVDDTNLHSVNDRYRDFPIFDFGGIGI